MLYTQIGYLLQGAQVIHEAGMIHGDLNPTNCQVDVSLVGTDVQANAVVVDLGSCKDQTACEPASPPLPRLLLLLAT